MKNFPILVMTVSWLAFFQHEAAALDSRMLIQKWVDAHPGQNETFRSVDRAVASHDETKIRDAFRSAVQAGATEILYIAATEDSNNAVVRAATKEIASLPDKSKATEQLIIALDRSYWVREVVMENDFIHPSTQLLLEQSLCQLLGLDLETSIKKRVPLEVFKAEFSKVKATGALKMPFEQPKVNLEGKPLVKEEPPVMSTIPANESDGLTTPWSIVAVMIAAAFGLLWLLHKRRAK